MQNLDNPTIPLADTTPAMEVAVTVGMLHQAFVELGLTVPQPPLVGESFSDYLHRRPLDAILSIVRWGFHGIQP